MFRRKLDSGEIIDFEPSPHGPGNVYYAEHSPGGLVHIVDFNVIPLRLVIAACALEANKPLKQYPAPEPIFNSNAGWRY